MKNKKYIIAIDQAADTVLYLSEHVFDLMTNLAMRGEYKELGDLFDEGEGITMTPEYFDVMEDKNIKEVKRFFDKIIKSYLGLTTLNGLESRIGNGRGSLDEPAEIPHDTYEEAIWGVPFALHCLRVDIYTAAVNVLEDGMYNNNPNAARQIARELLFDPGKLEDRGDINVVILRDILYEIEQIKMKLVKENDIEADSDLFIDI